MGTARNIERTHTTTTTSLCQHQHWHQHRQLLVCVKSAIARAQKQTVGQHFGITDEKKNKENLFEKPAISKRTDATCLHWVDNHHKPVFAKETKLNIKETLIFLSFHFKEMLKDEDLSNWWIGQVLHNYKITCSFCNSEEITFLSCERLLAGRSISFTTIGIGDKKRISGFRRDNQDLPT